MQQIVARYYVFLFQKDGVVMGGEYLAAFMEALADAIKYGHLAKEYEQMDAGFLADLYQMNVDAFERLVKNDGA